MSKRVEIHSVDMNENGSFNIMMMDGSEYINCYALDGGMVTEGETVGVIGVTFKFSLKDQLSCVK